jgi:GT2 family glycosyltransferase
MKQSPFVSVIIVNYNGRKLLETCIPAVLDQTYPRKKFEVIVVDNNSSDDSLPFLRSRFSSELTILEAGENLGFTGGNELGFQHARGEYIVMLNSDVVTDPGWLAALVAAAEPKDVGLVSSRLRYSIPFVEVTIRSLAVPRSQISVGIDHSPVGVLIEDILCESDVLSSQIWYKDGFYDKQVGEVTTRRTNGEAKILLPFPMEGDEHFYKIAFHGLETNDNLATPIQLVIGDEVVFETTLKPREVRQVEVTLTKKQVKKHLTWLIQNAGNIVLANGYGKDRGSVLQMRDNEIREGYEEESEYFLKPAPLLCACGASCLIKRAVIDHVGFLDGTYFMYYEDMELSLRAWRAGWKIVYAPKSLGYHKHRATTGAVESVFFLKQVERNHLAYVVVHFPIATVISELYAFTLRFLVTAVKSFIFQFRDDEQRAQSWKTKFYGRKAAMMTLLETLPHLFSSRRKMAKYWPMDERTLKTMMY